MPALRVNRRVASIWQRYVAFSVLLAVLIAASCTFLGLAIVLGSDSTQNWRDSTRTLAGVDTLNSDLVAVGAAVHASVETDRPGPLRALLPELKPASAQAAQILATASTPKERAIVRRLRGAEAAIVHTWISPGIRTWGHTSASVKRQRYALLDQQIAAGQAALLAFVTAKQNEAAALGTATARTRTHVIVGATILLALALALLVVAAVQLGRLVVKPAQQLELAVSRITQGDLDTAVPVGGPREFASIAARFNVMREVLKSQRVRDEERMQSRLELASAKQEAARLESLNIVSGGVAHEFNNLLQAIVGQAELLRADIPDRARDGFEDIERAAWKAGRLARTMLLASGQGTYVQSEVPAEDVVTALDEFSPCPVEVDFVEIERKRPLVGDVAHLRQALGAVVANACEAYGHGGGTVDVRVEEQSLHAHDLARLMHSAAVPGEFVVFTIEDRGEGMSPQTVARACDPFFTTRFPGRGLGLATALGVTRGHHGAIDIASERGRGTTVRLFFPVAA